MIRIFCFTLIGLIFSYKTSYSQEVKTLQGVVSETDSKGNIKPIESASIHWLGTQTGTQSDSNGVFHIPFSNQTKRLIVSYVGYKTDTIFISKQNFIKVVLINKNVLDEFSVSYERKSTEVSFIDPWKTSIMNEKELFKSACCNLSESFETNPSVDVSFADALTGTKQIQMLGLASQYTLMTQENIPSTRGIAANIGTAYTPGSWLKNIQITKGQGSVVNGFESLAGQINTELHSTEGHEKISYNAYAGAGGRLENNLIYTGKIGANYSHVILLHANATVLERDHNKDGFMDNPIGRQYNFMYRFRYNLYKGLNIFGGFRYVNDSRTGGQLDYSRNYDSLLNGYKYGIELDSKRTEAFLKIGYVFPNKVYKSIGLQLNGVKQDNQALFGYQKYSGQQNSLYANLIYQSVIVNTNHKFRTGLSFQYDQHEEQLNKFTYELPINYFRKEQVSGSFFEYTFSHLAIFTMVAGLRADYNSIFGGFLTPRLHLRYAPLATTVIRVSMGRGQRTPSLLGENLSLLASSRRFYFPKDNLVFITAPKFYDLNRAAIKPEIAWNYGASITHEFKFNYRPATIGFDYFYTNFSNQLVVDRYSNSKAVSFYNLDGKSYSHSAQIQLDIQPKRRFDMRLAYRFYDVKTQYTSGLLDAPLLAKHRAFSNFSYQTKNKWSFDYTFQWIGQKPLPGTAANHHGDKFANYSEDFFLSNIQVSKSFFNKQLEVYAGIENLFNFQQHHAILNANNPRDEYFDATLIWGPIFGRMEYAGLRWKPQFKSTK
jgi:hypothetical protein